MKTQHSKIRVIETIQCLEGNSTSNAYLRKIPQIKGLSFHFKKLEKSKLKPKHVEKNNKGRNQ